MPESMTPVEKMWRAYDEESVHWEVLKNETRPFYLVIRWGDDEGFSTKREFDFPLEAKLACNVMRSDAAMRAALRALAEMNFPFKVVDAAWGKDGGICATSMREALPAVLLAAASEGEQE